ncbi:ArsR/SmtB family transcription factor [Patescibacteria group bacterium]
MKKMPEKLHENTQERIFKALANRRRLAILRYLRKHGESSVTDIAEVIGVSTSSTSKHLIDLAKANLVQEKKKGFYVLYSIHKKLHFLPKYILDQI